MFFYPPKVNIISPSHISKSYLYVYPHVHPRVHHRFLVQLGSFISFISLNYRFRVKVMVQLGLVNGDGHIPSKG